MVTQIALIFAGIGFCFTGIAMLNTNLQKLLSRQFRKLLLRWSDNKWVTTFVSSSFAAVVQDTNMLAIVSGNLVTTGVLKLRDALRMVFWGNPTSVLIIFIGTVDIGTGVNFLISICAVALVFVKEERWRYAITSLFGLAILYYGVELMRGAAGYFATETSWVQDLVSSTTYINEVAFILAIILRVILQSTNGTVLVAMSLVKMGLFDLTASLMFLYGTRVGSSITTWLLSQGIKGRLKQVILSQFFFNITGVLLFVILFYLEQYFHFPLVEALIRKITLGGDLSLAIANLAVIFEMGSAIVLTCMMTPFVSFIKKISPRTKEEDLSRCQFIQPGLSIDDPESELDLVVREQATLFQRILKYRFTLSDEEKGASKEDLDVYHRSFNSVSEEVDNRIGELLSTDTLTSTTNQIYHSLEKHNILVSIEEDVYHFTLAAMDEDSSDSIKEFISKAIEALDFVLLTSNDALESLDDMDISLLQMMTRDEGDVMGQIRKDFLSKEINISSEEKSKLLMVTQQFGRIIWLVGKIAKLLEEEKNLKVKS